MKILYFVIVLLVCFCIIYCKIYRREQFMKQVKIVTNIGDFEQEKIYLVQDEKLFLNDIELFYKDSRCKKRGEKKYIRAVPKLLWRIAEKSDKTEEIVFPMLVKMDGNKIRLSEYEEIWSKRC